MSDGDRRRMNKKRREQESSRIYELRCAGLTIASLAERFGYSPDQIGYILRTEVEKRKEKDGS